MFGDFRPVGEIEKEMYTGYGLEYYDRGSLKELEHAINLRAYDSIDSVKEHMEFLERLLYKLQAIRIEEIKEGFPTSELDKSISEINLLFKKLTSILYLLKGYQ